MIGPEIIGFGTPAVGIASIFSTLLPRSEPAFHS